MWLALAGPYFNKEGWEHWRPYFNVILESCIRLSVSCDSFSIHLPASPRHGSFRIRYITPFSFGVCEKQRAYLDTCSRLYAHGLVWVLKRPMGCTYCPRQIRALLVGTSYGHCPEILRCESNCLKINTSSLPCLLM